MNTDRTALFYMANLGSEVARALLEYEKEDFETMRNSIVRAEDIIKKIEALTEMKGRTGELEILKSIIEDLNRKKFELNKDQLLDYFSPFATRLMI
jgi:5-bromo-4-chloroindolyl phosphate hydrolysis protein